ncbi:MAG: hypothetical protein INH41_30395 [Myxococcaceae bacterium]|jgi:flagella basal body P-ring formation protein FlgA|nr:hypothetical protein [Myxococcaceae bacterium]MCA3016715.1 hypothetical protein [Myxococcaceae bacterium]
MTLLALAVIAAVPAPLVEALQARAPEGTRVEVDGFTAPGCVASRFEPQPVEGSGRVAVRVSGRGCAAWGWATVRVLSTQAVLTRDLEAGARIEGAVRVEERPWRRGDQVAPALEGAVAARRLRAGQPLRAVDVRFGPPPGTPIVVRIVVNTISVEQRGTVVSCGQQVCATLPSGRRVAGVLRDGVLVSNAERGT